MGVLTLTSQKGHNTFHPKFRASFTAYFNALPGAASKGKWCFDSGCVPSSIRRLLVDHRLALADRSIQLGCFVSRGP